MTFRILVWCTAALVVCSSGTMSGQTIVAPVMSDAPLAPPAARPEPFPVPLSDIGSVIGSGLPLFRRGPITLRTHAAYRYSHSSGLLFAPGEPLSTQTQTVSAGSALELGEHWTADYTADWVRYSDPRFKNGLNHAASIASRYEYLNWSFAAAANYRFGYPMLVETGYQTREESLGTSVSAHGTVGQRSFVDLSLSQSDRKANAITTDTPWQRSTLRDWSGRVALGQSLTRKLSAALGVTAGYGTEELGADMSYIRPELTAAWTPTEKITVGAMAGWERRRFRDSDAGPFNNPVYASSVTYRPGETTSVTAGVSEGVAASYIGSAVTKSTGWNMGFRQRLLQVLYANLGYARQRSRYYETVATLPHERADNYDSISASLALAFLQHGSTSVFYNRTHNGSNQPGYGFTSTEYGAEVGFTF